MDSKLFALSCFVERTALRNGQTADVVFRRHDRKSSRAMSGVLTVGSLVLSRVAPIRVLRENDSVRGESPDYIVVYVLQGMTQTMKQFVIDYCSMFKRMLIIAYPRE